MLTGASDRDSLFTSFAVGLALLALSTTSALAQSPELVAEQTAELYLDKDGSGGITAGDLIHYEVTITNIGTQADLELVFDETIVDGASLEAGSVVVVGGGDVSLGNNDEDPQVVVESEMLETSSSITITFQARVDNILEAESVAVANQGVVLSQVGHPGGIGTDDPDTAEVGDATVTPLKRPDLSVAANDAGGAVEPGQLLVYSVSYANNGNAHSVGSSVVETVPIDSTFNAAASTPGWDCVDGAPAGTPCTFDLGFLDIGDFGVLDFAVDVSESVTPGMSQLFNVAAIGDDGSHGADEDASNNLDILITDVATHADVALAVKPLLDPVMAGAVQLYEFVATNHGPLAVSGVTVDFDLPDGVEFLGAEPADPDCLVANGTVTCALGSIAVDESLSAFVSARIDPFFEGAIDGSAVVSADQTDQSLTNNTVAVDEQVDPLMVADSLPDFSGNGVDEIAVFSFVDGMARVTVSDADTGELLTSFSLSSEYRPLDLEILPDFGGTGAAELALLAKDPIGGNSRVFIRDAGDGEVLSSRGLSSAFLPHDLEILPDMNASGADELAILEINPATSESRITVKDPEPSSTLLTVTLDSDQTALEIERTGDGRLAVLGVGTATAAASVSFYDELDGSDLGRIDYTAGWAPSELEVLADIDGNAADEIVVLFRQRATGKNRLFVTDSVTASENRISLDDSMVARDLEVIADFKDTSADELVVSLAVPDGSAATTWIKDGSSKKTLSKIYQNPDWLAHDLAVIADFDGTSADEVVILSNDGTELEVRVKDASSTKKLTNFKPF